MTEARHGQDAAFRQLADQRLDGSLRLATAILGDGSQSQDALHDAVLLARERWPTLRDQARFDARFDRIIVNVCRDQLWRSARRPTIDHSSQVALGTPDRAPGDIVGWFLALSATPPRSYDYGTAGMYPFREAGREVFAIDIDAVLVACISSPRRRP